MAGVPASTSSGYVKKRLGAYATPPEVRALPQLETEGYEYGKGQSAAAAREAEYLSLVERYDLAAGTERMRMDEAVRQRSMEMAALEGRLRTLNQQNTLASLLGIGGLAVTGLKGYTGVLAAEEREAQTNRLIDVMKGVSAERRAAVEREGVETEGVMKKLYLDALRNNSYVGW